MIIFQTIDGQTWKWDFDDENDDHWELVLDVRLRLNTWIPGFRLNGFYSPIGSRKNILTRTIVTWEKI